MNSEVLASAIVGHLVGDYLLQNDWMAINKKKRTLPCVVHSLLWTLAVMGFAGWYGATEVGYANEKYWFDAWVFATLFGTHFIQDRTAIVLFWMTSINSQKAFAAPPTAPWSIIVVDNVWHVLTIWIVWRFIA